MLDSSLLFWAGNTLTDTADSTAVAVNKTPDEGLDLFFNVTDVSGDTPTLDLAIQESDTLGSGYVTIAVIPTIEEDETGAYQVTVKTNKKYLRVHAVLGHSTGEGDAASVTLMGGIASGVQRNAYA